MPFWSGTIYSGCYFVIRSSGWGEDAACFGHDRDPESAQALVEVGKAAAKHGVEAPRHVGEFYFPPRVKALYHVYADEAKNYCLGKDRRHPCPVRRECLLWAIRTNEEHGLWGGMSHRERNALVRQTERKGLDIVEVIDGMDR